MAIKTRQQAIDELIQSVYGWDIPRLTAFVQSSLKRKLKTIAKHHLEDMYNFEFNESYEDLETHTKIIDTKASRLLYNGDKK